MDVYTLLLLVNLSGVVACHTIARSRSSQRVVFWTMMGILFGALAIPFVTRNTRSRAASR